PCSVWSDTVLRPQLDPILTRVRVSSSFSLPLPKSTLFPYTTLFRSTMAVTFIIGNSFRISGSIFSPGTTISAAIASEFAESDGLDRKSTRLNSSHGSTSYAVFCLKKQRHRGQKPRIGHPARVTVLRH